ncbi:PEP/pyruvate-binding domain-containing protein [Megalodesulfovibrio paquesii]
MAGILERLSSLFGARGKNAAAKQTALEEGRRTLQFRYEQFRLALEANTRALTGMADLAHACDSPSLPEPIAQDVMAWLDGQIVRIGREVFTMLRALQAMAPGQYASLTERFREIQREIQAQIRPNLVSPDGPLTLRISEMSADMGAVVGGKMAQLGEIRSQLLFNVPPGFAITVHGFALLRDAIGLTDLVALECGNLSPLFPQALHAACGRIRQRIMDATLPDELEEAIWKQFARLQSIKGKDVAVAVRSSAVGEDAPGASFAGQFRTLLNVREPALIDSIKEVIASLWSPAAVCYRKRLGIRETEAAMAVGVLTQENALCGGVAYSRHPLAPELDAVTIASNWGLPKSVVDGATPTDHFLVSRFQPMRVVERRVAVKHRKFICLPEEGVCRLEVNPEDASRPSLDDAQAIKVAHTAMRMEAYYGHPVDIEWCFGPSNTVTVLQCRPLEVAKDMQPPHMPPNLPPLLRDGRTASPGAAYGPAFIMQKEADMLQFPEGAVLVAETASPRYAALLPKAAAVLTEHGSLTGHLANVAREMGVPAVFGLEGARTHVPPGKLVTVDADLGMIFPGRVRQVLTRTNPKPLLGATPGRTAMQAVREKIDPLTMLDPHAPTFRAASCKTWHDITRFCHEKIVMELFEQAESLDQKMDDCDMRECRRLVAENAMQFWVLDLGGGVMPRSEELEVVEGVYMGRKISRTIVKKIVTLEEIVCQPMLALWRGMMAKPWEGPPPIDSRGLMSVFMEATTNPMLDVSRGSPMQNKNYFIISKDFVCLQSRFGFHFLTVEALVTPDPSNAYALFRFRGGAADLQRRSIRTKMVGELLAEFGYSIDLVDDALNAKVDCLPPEKMLRQLEVLGYLLMHTRQLDMVMADPNMVARYRTAIQQDIRAMYAGEPLPHTLQAAAAQPAAAPDAAASPHSPDVLPSAN